MKGERGRRARAEGQKLEASVFVGKAGLTDGNVAEVQAQLKGSALVKVKISRDAVDAKGRQAVAEELATRAGADLVEVRGLTVLLAKRGRLPGQ